MTERLLLIAGTPAAGKTHFGDWLSSAHGYLHCDLERDRNLESSGCQPAWDQVFKTGDATPLVNALSSLHRPVILNWGFPVHCLPVVEEMKRAGIELWWFHADPGAARKAFIRRDTVPLECFDIQMPGIAREWQRISAVFGENVIEVLSETGARLAPNEIWSRMGGAV